MFSEKPRAPDGYLPVPTTSPTKPTTGPISLGEDEPAGAVQPPSRARCSKAKKVVGLAVLGFLFVTFKHGLGHGGHGLRGLFSGEFREGWGYLRGGGGRDHYADWDRLDNDDNRSYLSLATTAVSLSAEGETTLVVPAATRELVLHFEDSVDATLLFATSDDIQHGTAAHIHLQQIPAAVDEAAVDADEDADADADDAAVRAFDAGSAVAGVLVAGSDSSYVVTVTLPGSRSHGRPVSLTAHGESLSIPAIDLSGFRFDKFSLSPSPDKSIAINNLHANEGKIVLTAGDIVGSFNVSRELVLRTTIGAIQANVSIHAPHHKSHGHEHKHKHNETEKPDEIDGRHGHHHEHDGPPHGPPPHGPPPHGPPPHDGPHPPPHHPWHHRGPPGLVKVFAKASVGAVDLLFVDKKISNHTTLVSKAVSAIGAVRVGVLHDFKGMFVEGAKIGEVAFENKANTTVKIIKEVHNGPGGFIKGFVGPAPPHHGGKHHGCPGKDKKHKKHDHDHHKKGDKDSNDNKHGHHARDTAEVEQDEQDDEPLFWTQEHDNDDHPSAPRHPHERPNPGGPHPPPPPPPPGPPGPPPHPGKGDHPHHHGPHHGPHHGGPPHHGPPPGYGFIGAFAGTGKVDVVFL